ncbi:hybrid sensor histidine kinase/response regulator [Marinobacter sp. SS21]|uniref:hybrid sensor histidine kinase/response regulator n=1 Tax=Marinobacter sp. SS21 TaxID=2979460 RepID=UPI002330AB04|nr:response regulator [Marinobacter sp. SS21]MDC0663418.1 response regulator [Marinobacter sp. SS21]
MANSNDELQQRLRQAFREEAMERLQMLADALAMIQQSPVDEAAVIERIFREVHSLKGAARAVSLKQVEQFCQQWESLLSALKHKQLLPTAEHWSLSRKARKVMQQLVEDEDAAVPESVVRLGEAFEVAAQGEPSDEASGSELRDGGVMESASEADAGNATSLTPPDTGPSRHLKVNVQRLDNLLFNVEALQQLKLYALEHAQAARDAAREFQVWRRNRHDVGTAARQLKGRLGEFNESTQSQLQTLLDQLDWSGDFLGQWEFRLGYWAAGSDQFARELVSLADLMRQEMQHTLILPCGVLTEGIPAMVQDIADDSGKEVRLEVTGDDLQVDKRVLDELRSPLQHLIRNAIDHGLEPPQQRQERGKASAGSLKVTFSHEVGDKFELLIQDDGRGMDSAALAQEALERGLVSAEELKTWSEERVYQLVFSSGFSTSAMITDLSGRGLGLAIVQEKVERLGGEIRIESQPGEGTTFLIRLPTTMATYRALLVKVTETVLAVPAQVVVKVLRVPLEELTTMENRLSLSLDGQVLPLWRLAEVLDLPWETSITAETWAQLVVLKVGGNTFALLVDEVLDDQEITIKPLGRQLKRVCNVLGATLLGNGEIVPLLHPQDLFESCRRTQAAPLREASKEDLLTKPRILVAEDSVTSRGLLKTILESVGYEVTTAVDGMEGWNLLKQSEFELLVSDIEMPRMDGFALTQRIRNDLNLRQLPVVLVTALQSPEDRERGLEAGANAYIVKSGFDQSNLLDVIRRLL